MAQCWGSTCNSSGLSGMSDFQLSQQLTGMVKKVLRAFIDLLGLGMIIGMCRDVAHLPETKPCLHIGNQTLFSRNAQHIAKAGLIDFSGAVSFKFKLPADHLDADLVNKLEVL